MPRPMTPRWTPSSPRKPIDAMLARLAAYSADHFGYSPDEANWGHAGTLDHYRGRLREISEIAFRAGECSEKQRKIVPHAIPE